MPLYHRGRDRAQQTIKRVCREKGFSRERTKQFLDLYAAKCRCQDAAFAAGAKAKWAVLRATPDEVDALVAIRDRVRAVTKQLRDLLYSKLPELKGREGFGNWGPEVNKRKRVFTVRQRERGIHREDY